MQHIPLCWGRITVCAIALGSLALAISPVTAQTTKDETTKASKPKRAKKAANDATSAASQPSPPATAAAKSGKAPAPVKNASDADIQAAKASGKVWVNTDTGVYHKGGQWFGATKQGKFMAEQDAVKAGYRAAKNEK